MIYYLYNKRLNTKLIHPRYGLWQTASKEEAESMLSFCKNYIKTFNIDGYEDDFVVQTLEDEICSRQSEPDLKF